MLGITEKKIGADYEQLLRAVFSCFHGQKKYYFFFSVGKFKTLKYSSLFTVYTFLNLLFCVCYYYCIFVACVITSLILMTDAVRILHLKNDEMQGSAVSKYVGIKVDGLNKYLTHMYLLSVAWTRLALH